MKTKISWIVLFVLTVALVKAQSAADLFTSSATQIYWLGIDFSHTKLVGGFTQFGGAGLKSANDIKSNYFPAWNGVVKNERDKYDLKAALRKENIIYETSAIYKVNAEASVENMESENCSTFSEGDIKNFVKAYKPQNTDGIGIVFIAECLNKSSEEASYYFVAINLKNNEVLIQEHVKSEPSGIGLRNYWAGSIYGVFKQIKSSYYKSWKSKYTK